MRFNNTSGYIDLALDFHQLIGQPARLSQSSNLPLLGNVGRCYDTILWSKGICLHVPKRELIDMTHTYRLHRVIRFKREKILTAHARAHTNEYKACTYAHTLRMVSMVYLLIRAPYIRKRAEYGYHDCRCSPFRVHVRLYTPN